VLRGRGSRSEVTETNGWSGPSSTISGNRRAIPVSNVVGHLSNGVSEPVLERACEYWRNVDKEIGDRIAKSLNGR